MDKFKELLESELLGEDGRLAIQEALESKLEEARKTEREKVEAELREEFTHLYQKDKDDLVEGLNRLVSEVATKYAKAQVVETRKIREERERLTKTIREERAFYRKQLREHIGHLNQYVIGKLREQVAGLAHDHEQMRRQRVVLQRRIKESKSVYDKKLQEHKENLQKFVFERFRTELADVAGDHKKLNAQRLTLMQEAREMKVQHKIAMREHSERLKTFVLGKLSEELRDVEAQKVELAEQKIALVKQLKEHRAHLTNETAASIEKLKGFVIENLRKEIVGLEEDRKELLEHKVRMIAEGRRKIEEHRRAFVQRASAILEEKIRTNMKVSMTKLKEDIQFARENIFGRRLFEAFQTEFMSSYLYEGTQLKKMSTQLSEARNQVNALMGKMEQQTKLLESANRKVAVVEERAIRQKTITELLSKLQGDKRSVMAELLESVKTTQLKDAFHKYLPTVLNESRGVKQKTTTLVNNNKPEVLVEKRTVSVTGNRPNKLAEAVMEDQTSKTETDNEILALRRLAGIEK